MSFSPKLIVEVIRENGDRFYIPSFYTKVDQVIGLNSDWFKIHIENKNNEYDWMMDEIDTLQIIIYMGYTKHAESRISKDYITDLRPMIHGWIARLSATFGSIGKIMTLEGGDASFMFNKQYTGDLMIRRNPAKKSKTLQDSYLVGSGWEIIKQVTRANWTTGVKCMTPDGIELVAHQSFMDMYKPIGGVTQTQYFPDGLTETERKALLSVPYYQVNNRNRLEVIDDIVGRTGYYAWVEPGYNKLYIATREWVRANQKTIPPLENWDKGEFSEGDNKDKGNWIKFKKLPHFENGLQFEIKYWNWEKDHYISHALIGPTDTQNLQKGIAHFIGNPKKDAAVIINSSDEPVTKESADRRAYAAINRIVTQRLVVSGQTYGNTDIIPGSLVPIKGCGKWDQNYLIVHASHLFSRKGYSTLFNARLPNLIETKNDTNVLLNPYTTVKVGNYVKATTIDSMLNSKVTA